MSNHRINVPFETRKNQSAALRQKYPDRIPVICEKNFKEKKLPTIDKTKYLVPTDITMTQFIFVIRKRMKLDPSESLILYIGDNYEIVNQSELIINIYEKFKNIDGFLYISYGTIATFG